MPLCLFASILLTINQRKERQEKKQERVKEGGMISLMLLPTYLGSCYIMMKSESVVWVPFRLKLPKLRELSFRIEYLITLISVTIVDVDLGRIEATSPLELCPPPFTKYINWFFGGRVGPSVVEQPVVGDVMLAAVPFFGIFTHNTIGCAKQ